MRHYNLEGRENKFQIWDNIFFNQLKALNTFEDLQNLFKIMRCVNNLYGFDFSLTSKRKGYLAFGFSEINNNRVHYLFDNGISTGNSAVCNLYKNLKIIVTKF